MRRVTGKLKALKSTLTHLVTHPVGQRRKVGAVLDWARWQVGARLVPGPVVVPWVGGAVLVVEPGMTGATGNVYSGLHEFADMGFLLHFLRPGDTFGDVGANVGSYAILAAAVCRATGIAVEPIAATAEKLRRNLAANRVMDTVEVAVCCVGASEGTAVMTSEHDTTNRITSSGGAGTVEVPMKTLDTLFARGAPTLLKVDVEGFEQTVLEGAARTLADPRLEAVIIEVTGDAAHEASIGGIFVRHGFQAVRYDPATRSLTPIAGPSADNANTIFVRDLNAARARVASANPFEIKGMAF